jgi:hypothetical protein
VFRNDPRADTVTQSVTRAEAQTTVIAFLDQFVGRGASPELRDLARRLTTEPDLQSQLDAHLQDDMTEREAFDAMRAFLAEWSSHAPRRQEGETDVFDLLSWTEWDPDGGTSDPAQWHDWITAAAATN